MTPEKNCARSLDVIILSALITKKEFQTMLLTDIIEVHELTAHT